MKVLRVSHSSVVHGWRQRERELIAAGHQVTLLTAREWDEGGVVVRLDPAEDDFVVGVRTIGTHPNLFAYSPRALWRALGEDWDIVDLHEEPYSLAAVEFLVLRWVRGLATRRPAAPFVLYSAQNISKRFPLPFRWTERWALRRVAGLSVCNSEAGRIAVSRGLRAPVSVIGLGVDLEQFRRRPSFSESTVTTVGYVGRLADHKGVGILLDALARSPRFHAVIVGSGPADASLRAHCDRLGLGGRVAFIGHRTEQDLPAIYRGFDVLAVPSLPTPNWREQFCRVAVEAMASGVPVVASRSGALPDVVGDAGLLVKPGDPVALSLALEAATTSEANRLKAAGPVRAQEYSWPRVARRHHDLYMRAVSGRTPLDDEDVPSPSLEIAVVAYGSPDALADALRPVAASWPTIVIDNSSSNAVRVVVEATGARYIDAGANLGFARGVNLAMRHRTPGRDLLLLNPDAVIQATALHALHAALHRDPWLGAVAPAQVDERGHHSRVTWPFPSVLRAWTEALGLGRWQRSEFVTGAVLLLRSDAIDQVGSFDERFFLYAEETDWERRAVNAGWQVAEIREIRALHLGAGTSKDSTRREAHFHASQERYYRKYDGDLGWCAVRLAVIVGAFPRMLLSRGERRRQHIARLRLYMRGPIRMEARMARTQE